MAILLSCWLCARLILMLLVAAQSVVAGLAVDAPDDQLWDFLRFHLAAGMLLQAARQHTPSASQCCVAGGAGAASSIRLGLFPGWIQLPGLGEPCAATLGGHDHLVLQVMCIVSATTASLWRTAPRHTHTHTHVHRYVMAARCPYRCSPHLTPRHKGLT